MARRFLDLDIRKLFRAVAQNYSLVLVLPFKSTFLICKITMPGPRNQVVMHHPTVPLTVISSEGSYSYKCFCSEETNHADLWKCTCYKLSTQNTEEESEAFLNARKRHGTSHRV